MLVSASPTVSPTPASKAQSGDSQVITSTASSEYIAPMSIVGM